MRRIFRRSIPPSVRAIENASRRPTLCFVVRDDENKTGGMIVREKNLPAEVGKTQTPPRSASEVIAEMAAKVARYPAKPKEEWEGMSAEELFERGQEHFRKGEEYFSELTNLSLKKEKYDRQGKHTEEAKHLLLLVKQEFMEAVKWYRPAAEQGHSKAQYVLGHMYAQGEYAPLDTAEAVKWYRRSAEQGYVDAQNTLGVKYATGIGVPQDYVEAVKWYRRAAKQGLAIAQSNLGSMHEKGKGVPQNYTEAVKWFRRATEQECAAAQYNLGWMYEKGKGVPQNDAEAVKWYRRAAEQGDYDAHNALHRLEQKK